MGRMENLRPFQPGQSGNPGGRRKMDADSKRMLLDATQGAVRLLVETVENDNAPLSLRVRCAETILDRVYGKASQPIAAELKPAERELSLDEMMQAAKELIADSPQG